MTDRNGFIEAAINMGIKDPSKINQGLTAAGFDQLNKAEGIMVQEGTYGTNIGQRFIKGVGDLGAGIATIGGGVYSYLTDPEMRSEINKSIGQELSKGPSGVALDAVNLMLSPYNNLTVERGLTQPLSETITDITAGAYAHPFDATLDALSLGGGAAAYKALQKGSKHIPDVKGLRTIKGIATGLFDPTTRRINQILNTSKNIPVEELNNLRTKALNISEPNNQNLLVQAYKNLETSKNKWTGTPEEIAFTRQVKDFAEDVNKLMVKAGVDPNKAREVAETQYVLRQLQNEGRNIPFDDVRKILNNDGATLKKYGYTWEDYENKFKPLKAEAKASFDSGFIFPVRHGSLGTDLNNNITRTEFGPLSSRMFGNQSFEDSAKGFFKNYTELFRDLEKSDQSLNALAEIARSVGVKVTDINNIKLKDNQVLISPNKLKVDIGLGLSGEAKLDDAFKIPEVLRKEDFVKYADDLYIVNKRDLNAFKGAYQSVKDNLRGASKTLGDISSLGKQVVLGTPRYVIGNQITNMGLNAIEGVTPRHYLLAKGEYQKYIPEALKNATSYRGYLEGELPLETTARAVYKRLARDIKEGNALTKLKALNMAITYPVFATASKVETLDRSANYIRQAEKYAKTRNTTIEEILKEAKQNKGNNQTYRTLKEMVDNSLGDYTGRNYYLDPRIDYWVRQTMIPFYRPYTQGLRVLGTHTVNNPLSQQLLLRNPARVGEQITENFVSMGGEEDPRYGGFPVRFPTRYNPAKVAYTPYNAVTSLGEVARDPGQFLTQGNTFIVPLLFPTMGLNRYGDQAKLPNSYTINGKQYILDENGNATNMAGQNAILNAARLFAANVSNAYLAPVNITNRVGLPLLSEILKETYRAPSDYSIFGQIGERSIPFLFEGRQSSKGKRTTGERVLPLFGLNVVDVYNMKKPMDIKSQKSVRRAIKRQQKRLMEE